MSLRHGTAPYHEVRAGINHIGVCNEERARACPLQCSRRSIFIAKGDAMLAGPVVRALPGFVTVASVPSLPSPHRRPATYWDDKANRTPGR